MCLNIKNQRTTCARLRYTTQVGPVISGSLPYAAPYLMSRATIVRLQPVATDRYGTGMRFGHITNVQTNSREPQ